MDTTGLFDLSSSDIKICQLRHITKDRIDSFLPDLWKDLFKYRKLNEIKIQCDNLEKNDLIDDEVVMKGSMINKIKDLDNTNIPQPEDKLDEEVN